VADQGGVVEVALVYGAYRHQDVLDELGRLVKQ
jgi:hypothetical protein